MNKETEAAKGKSHIWIYIILILAIAIIGSIIYRNHIESNATGVQKNEQPAPVAEAAIQEAEPCTTAEPEIVCDDNYDKGVEAFKMEEGDEAIDYFTLSGSAESHYMLGLIYENGCGTIAPNPLLARDNYKKAAEMGNTDAQAKLNR